MHREPHSLPAALPWRSPCSGRSPGCSEGTATPIDPKATVDKASGGDGKARQSAKGKAASAEAAEKHPKLH